MMTVRNILKFHGKFNYHYEVELEIQVNQWYWKHDQYMLLGFESVKFWGLNRHTLRIGPLVIMLGWPTLRRNRRKLTG
jgi:hypothetical protein